MWEGVQTQWGPAWGPLRGLRGGGRRVVSSLCDGVGQSQGAPRAQTAALTLEPSFPPSGDPRHRFSFRGSWNVSLERGPLEVPGTGPGRGGAPAPAAQRRQASGFVATEAGEPEPIRREDPCPVLGAVQETSLLLDPEGWTQATRPSSPPPSRRPALPSASPRPSVSSRPEPVSLAGFRFPGWPMRERLSLPRNPFLETSRLQEGGR